ncbi:hypothetical protein OIV83_001896 [Microbotryomycetes sp. JL201]|nr:hypothetical protein OIV83_001896 [Microbotryomycetes sp. JL201]
MSDTEMLVLSDTTDDQPDGRVAHAYSSDDSDRPEMPVCSTQTPMAAHQESEDTHTINQRHGKPSAKLALAANGQSRSAETSNAQAPRPQPVASTSRLPDPAHTIVNKSTSKSYNIVLSSDDDELNISPRKPFASSSESARHRISTPLDDLHQKPNPFASLRIPKNSGPERKGPLSPPRLSMRAAQTGSKTRPGQSVIPENASDNESDELPTLDQLSRPLNRKHSASSASPHRGNGPRSTPVTKRSGLLPAASIASPLPSTSRTQSLPKSKTLTSSPPVQDEDSSVGTNALKRKYANATELQALGQTLPMRRVRPARGADFDAPKRKISSAERFSGPDSDLTAPFRDSLKQLSSTDLVRNAPVSSDRPQTNGDHPAASSTSNFLSAVSDNGTVQLDDDVVADSQTASPPVQEQQANAILSAHRSNSEDGKSDLFRSTQQPPAMALDVPILANVLRPPVAPASDDTPRKATARKSAAHQLFQTPAQQTVARKSTQHPPRPSEVTQSSSEAPSESECDDDGQAMISSALVDAVVPSAPKDVPWADMMDRDGLTSANGSLPDAIKPAEDVTGSTAQSASQQQQQLARGVEKLSVETPLEPKARARKSFGKPPPPPVIEDSSSGNGNDEYDRADDNDDDDSLEEDAEVAADLLQVNKSLSAEFAKTQIQAASSNEAILKDASDRREYSLRERLKANARRNAEREMEHEAARQVERQSAKGLATDLAKEWRRQSRRNFTQPTSYSERALWSSAENAATSASKSFAQTQADAKVVAQAEEAMKWSRVDIVRELASLQVSKSDGDIQKLVEDFVREEQFKRPYERRLTGPALQGEFEETQSILDHMRISKRKFERINKKVEFSHPSHRFTYEQMINDALSNEVSPTDAYGNDIEPPHIRIVPLENGLPPFSPPFEFVYTNRVVYGAGIPLQQSPGCECQGDCGSKLNSARCACRIRQQFSSKRKPVNEEAVRSNGKQFAYTTDKRIRHAVLERQEPIWECNSMCGCGPECVNRVVGRIPRYSVDIFRTEESGWAVRNPPAHSFELWEGEWREHDPIIIPRGSPLGIYAGELLSPESRKILKRNYIFDLDSWHSKDPKARVHPALSVLTNSVVKEDKAYLKYVLDLADDRSQKRAGLGPSGEIEDKAGYLWAVDAFYYGSWTRFCNHRCSTWNASIMPVYVDEGCIERPLNILVAAKDIYPGEEIAITYSGSRPELEPGQTLAQFQEEARKRRSKVDESWWCFCGDELCFGIMFAFAEDSGSDDSDEIGEIDENNQTERINATQERITCLHLSWVSLVPSSPLESDSMASDRARSHASVPLPLATLLLDARPEHALTSELYDPVVKRVAHVEAAVQTSAAAKALRRIGLRHATVTCLACSAMAAGVYRCKLQWRAMLAVLGVGEAAAASLHLLADLDDRRDNHASARLSEQEHGKDMDDQLVQDTRHLACFWLVYASLAVLESVRSTATEPGNGVQRSVITSRLKPAMRYLRVMVRKLANKYTRLEFLAPSRSRVRRPFPQPRPLAATPAVAYPAVARWLSSELKYRLLKLLFLWAMLRRDGFGASAIWDWLIGPFFAVHRRRQVALDDAGQKRRRVARLVIDDVEDGTVPEAVSPRPDMFDHDSVSTSTSPAYTRHSYSSDRDCSTNETSFSTSTAAPSFSLDSPFAGSGASNHGSPAFPTPNVPFRLTSTSHPIRATMASTGLPEPKLHVGADSPTPTSRSMKGFDLGASMDSDKSWIGAKEWAS